MYRLGVLLLSAALAVLVLPVPAQASPVGVGSWYEFSFTGVGVLATGCKPADPAGQGCTPSGAGNSTFAPPRPWEFVVGSGGALLRVTDAFVYGDAFEIFNFGGPLFSTPLATGTGSAPCGSNPEACWADPLMSHGGISLTPGLYSLTIAPYETLPGGGGAAYFDLRGDAAPVPEPASLLLLATGLVGLARRTRRR